MVLLAEALNLIAGFGMKALGMLVVLFIGVRVIKWANKKLESSKAMEKLEPSLRGFVANGISICLYALLAVSCCGIIGIQTASLITVLASCGVAVGLALQGALSNVAGGIMILLFKPFKVGDFVEAGGATGIVRSITIFYTFIDTLDNKVIMVPNGNITGSNVTNYSTNGLRRVDIDFTAAYGSDTEQVKALMLEVASKHEKVLADPAPFARMSKQDASACVYTLRVWCNNADYWDVYFDIMEGMKAAFDAKGIQIPYQQLDVHLDK